MFYQPQTYRIADEPMKPFIDADEVWAILHANPSTKERVRDIIAQSLAKQRLALADTAVLVNTTDPDIVEELKQAAHTLKERIYGERIVLFAPLYVGNECINNCQYCGFRVDNVQQRRHTLTSEELRHEVKILEDNGHKRLILVFGEHPLYSAEFIADTVTAVYGVKSGQGEIRRVNINAAPLTMEGFRTVKKAKIGTYQVFQETYNPNAYARVHPDGMKRNYEYRLTALDRAQEAGIDDVGIGALFGIYDWRFDVLGLVRHVNHLEAVYRVGPHTISFPRIQNASALNIDPSYAVNDDDFLKIVAILRLAVPYTGMILTAREPAPIRRQALRLGVSQIDGGTNIQLGGYARGQAHDQDLNTEQFQINDSRPLSEIIDELIDTGYMPSFCTACYRRGRTGEHFMEFSVPGFIKRFCDPNAMLTLAEYLEDYATPELKAKADAALTRRLNGGVYPQAPDIKEKLDRIQQGERDLFY